MQRVFSTFHIYGSSIPFNENVNYNAWSKPNEPPIKSKSDLMKRCGKNMGDFKDMGFNSMKDVIDYKEHIRNGGQPKEF